MKEEKRKSMRLNNHTLQRASILKANHKQGFQTMQLKENTNPNLNLHKPSNKVIKRIGSKPTVKAFQAIVSENSPQQNKPMKQVQNKHQITNELQKPEVHAQNHEKYEEHNEKHDDHKKLKRIGKKTYVNAYKQIIIEEQLKKQENNGDKNNNIKKSKKQSQIITNNQQIIEQIQQKISQYKSKNEIQSLLAKDDMLGQEQITSVAMKKVVSEEGSFSINVNSALESKIQENSVFDKSDRCIETPIKTQSNVGASNSFIIQGELQKLINEDEKFSYVESNGEQQQQQDEKIKELIEQIQQNFQKNKQQASKKLEESKNKRSSKQSKQRTSIQRNSSNFLKVPNQRMSNNKSSSDVQSQRLSGNSFGFSDISSLHSKNLLEVNKTKQQMKTNSQMGNTTQSFLSQQEKILQLLQEKHKSKNDIQSSKLNNIKQKVQQTTNNQKNTAKIVTKSINTNINKTQNKKQTQQKQNEQNLHNNQNNDQITKQYSKYDSILQQIVQAKQDENRSESTTKNINIKTSQIQHIENNTKMTSSIKKPLPMAYPERLLRSEGPRRLIKQSKTSEKDEKMTQSSIVKAKQSYHTPNKLNESQTQFSQLKIKQRNNENQHDSSILPKLPTKSLHEPIKTQTKQLKRESIANRFGNNKPKAIQAKTQQSKASSLIKRTSKKLQVNKCVTQARKTLHQDSYI